MDFQPSERAQRYAQRVRAFIDLAVQRLQDCPDYLLTMEELERAAAAGAAALSGG